MNRTIYVRDEDEHIWERAKELAGAKGLSSVIMEGLKNFLMQEETRVAQAKGFYRIQIDFNDAEEHNVPKKKAFVGTWIIPNYDPLKIVTPCVLGGTDEDFFSVALTARGNAVFYSWKPYGEEKLDERFAHYQSLEEAAAIPRLNPAARAAIRRIGIRVEELDI